MPAVFALCFLAIYMLVRIPIDWPAREQTYRAQLLYKRSGRSAWPTCGRYL